MVFVVFVVFSALFIGALLAANILREGGFTNDVAIRAIIGGAIGGVVVTAYLELRTRIKSAIYSAAGGGPNENDTEIGKSS